jgi:lipopolysaccharide transport protein LptA
MNKYLYYFALIILSFSSAYGETELNLDAININSDKLSLDQEESSAVFTGSVVVEFEDLELKTDNIKALYKKSDKKNKLDTVIIPQKFVVTKSGGKEIVIADSGLYMHDHNKLILKGNVILYKDGDIIISDKAVYITKIKQITQKNV